LKVFQLGLSASSAGIIAYYDFPDACSWVDGLVIILKLYATLARHTK
jgi:hypothetical protein